MIVLVATAALAGGMEGHVEVRADRLVVWNDGATDWTNVMVTADNGQTCVVASVPANGAAQLTEERCTRPRTTTLTNVHIKSDQGETDLRVAGASTIAGATGPAKATNDAPLAAQIRIGYGLIVLRRLVVFNQSAVDWHGCVATIQGGAYKFVYRYALEAGMEDTVMLPRFRDSFGSGYTGGSPITDVTLQCNEGKAWVVPN